MSNITNNDEPRKAAYTPGPWFVADWDDDFGDNLLVVESRYPTTDNIWPDGIGKKMVADLREGSQESQVQALMDARLIAAAPDLLEALQAFLKMYLQGANSGDWGNWNPEEEPEIIAVRAAVAKALGQ